MVPRILIVEDEDGIRELLLLHLKREGYEIHAASTGLEALAAFESGEFDLILLDIMLPDIDGFKIVRRIREHSSVPVIFISARTDDADKVLGLELGADDYVSKPFSPLEILSRVRAQLRRYLQYSGKETSVLVTNGDLSLDCQSYEIRKSGQILDFNPKEFSLVSLLIKNPGKVYTKQQLYELVWEENYYGDDNTIMVHISHIRDKIEDDPKKPVYLKTIRGIGYKMEKL